ncbi:MAG: sigma-70 family RNA polymerase sigma factor [Planctomycetota bacterium]|nr:sigma-70 family RNA polymerase sigma factor [Planctomycetota bacterium]
MSEASNVTQILNALSGREQASSEQLLPIVYRELRRLASRQSSQEKLEQTLQGTALVHESYVRLVDGEHQQRWDSRGHFFAAAAEAMRRILVESARRKQSLKHGGDYEQVELQDGDFTCDAPGNDLLVLDEALARLEQESPDKAKLVKLRYFAGLTLEQAAEALNISRATASRHWTYARAWLYVALSDD